MALISDVQLTEGAELPSKSQLHIVRMVQKITVPGIWIMEGNQLDLIYLNRQTWKKLLSWKVSKRFGPHTRYM